MEKQQTEGRMNIWTLLKNILPFVLPYRGLIMVTLVLTLAGSLMAQVNAVVLDKAVDAINELIQTPGGFQWKSAVTILTVINTVNNFFIEILPLFTSAVLALVLMFAANVYVGLVALCIVISHNIGQIIDADQIYVLENGHVVQQGTSFCLFFRR